jgi:hypothetical protein
VIRDEDAQLSLFPDEPAPAEQAAPLDLRGLRLDMIPDVRDGLTRAERVVLYCLHECEKERPGRNVLSAMLYGRVVEHVNLSVPEFQRILQRLVGVR